MLWRKRGRPWHDRDVIVLLLPALACAVWIGVGGLVLDVERSDDARLLLEVAPGIALTGMITTLISYHGRPGYNVSGNSSQSAATSTAAPMTTATTHDPRLSQRRCTRSLTGTGYPPAAFRYLVRRKE